MRPRRRFDKYFTVLGSSDIPTTNVFFRAYHGHCAQLPRIIRSTYDPATPINIAEVGCSKGMETWSILAMLAVNGINQVHIDASDVSPLMLERASGPYKATKDQLVEWAADWNVPAECADFFDVPKPGYISPGAELRARATFSELDIRRTKLDASRYGFVICNNVLQHYDHLPRVQSKIVANMAVGLQPGGHLAAIYSESPMPENAYATAGLQPRPELDNAGLPYPRFHQRAS
ncbi:MAG TPA: CheR family methyltransferase [Patescibacteria group bacterium]|nr:CheR family methyltransferase [Patescibacteria group bacterium]